jgi:hypothetical protein
MLCSGLAKAILIFARRFVSAARIDAILAVHSGILLVASAT